MLLEHFPIFYFILHAEITREFSRSKNVQLLKVIHENSDIISFDSFIEQIDAQGIQPIQSVLKELKGWPITRKNSEGEDVTDWQDLHIFYSKMGVFPLYEISVNNDALRRIHTILVHNIFLKRHKT